MTKQHKAIIFALISILLWSTVATAFKLALNQMDYYHLLLFSSCSSSVTLLIIMLSTGNIIKLKRLRPKDVLFSGISGFINPFLYYLVLFKSYSILPAQIAQPLNYTWPIILVILSALFLKQKINKRHIISFLLCMIGIFLISFGGSKNIDFDIIGIILALFSAFIWAGYWILNTKDKRDDSVKLFLNFIFGTIFILLYIIIFVGFTIPSPIGLLSTTYIGLFEMGITFYLWSKALSLTKSTASISTMVYLSPFLSLIFISLILGEQIYLTTFIGLIIIIIAILYKK